MTIKIDSKKFELLTKWYLRFNGYFTVDNYIIHAADDIQRISNGTVGNYTDFDVIGLRMPFHFEQTGELEIKPDGRLQCIEKIDIIIAECKTGKQNGLNSVWANSNTHAIEYLMKFCGLFATNDQIKEAVVKLLTDLKFENDKFRIRPILFGQLAPNKNWQEKGLSFISCLDMIDFLIGQRGECWIQNDIGIKSIHDSWATMIKDIFKVANDPTTSKDEKMLAVYELLK